MFLFLSQLYFVVFTKLFLGKIKSWTSLQYLNLFAAKQFGSVDSLVNQEAVNQVSFLVRVHQCFLLEKAGKFTCPAKSSNTGFADFQGLPLPLWSLLRFGARALRTFPVEPMPQCNEVFSGARKGKYKRK